MAFQDVKQHQKLNTSYKQCWCGTASVMMMDTGGVIFNTRFFAAYIILSFSHQVKLNVVESYGCVCVGGGVCGCVFCILYFFSVKYVFYLYVIFFVSNILL